jgi:hypothetical protein
MAKLEKITGFKTCQKTTPEFFGIHFDKTIFTTKSDE